MASASSHPIKLGHTFDKKRPGKATSSSSYISFKYNFMPPSIVESSTGYLHPIDKTTSQWSLEYDMRQKDDDRRDTRSSAQGFQGSQSAVKDYDCVLVWDETSQCYNLDRLASVFTFKYDRGHSKLSEEAVEGLASNEIMIEHDVSESSLSALGLELSLPNQGKSTLHKAEGKQIAIAQESSQVDKDDDDDNDNFVRQLELGLEAFDEDKPGIDFDVRKKESQSPPQAMPGLKIIKGNVLQDSVMTPYGSPLVDDHPRAQKDTLKSTLGQNRGILSSQMTNSTARNTPVVSPPSLVNSPRMSALDSVLPSSSSWRPPPQRSNVAIAYDEDDEEGEDDSDDDEEDGEEDEEDDDDDDFDSFARQLENSLQG